MPTIGPEGVYYVRYGPNTTETRYLSVWWGPDVSACTAGQSVPARGFDIANVFLLSPVPRDMVILPAAFAWEPRGIAGDAYRWRLFDPDGSGPWWSGIRGVRTVPAQ